MKISIGAGQIRIPGYTNIHKVDKLDVCEVDGSCCTARDQLEHKQISMVLNMVAEK